MFIAWHERPNHEIQDWKMALDCTEKDLLDTNFINSVQIGKANAIQANCYFSADIIWESEDCDHHCWSLDHYTVWPLENWSPYRFSTMLLFHHNASLLPLPTKFVLFSVDNKPSVQIVQMLSMVGYGEIFVQTVQMVGYGEMLTRDALLMVSPVAPATPANIHQHHHSRPF